MLLGVFYHCFEVFSLVESYSLHLASHTKRDILSLREARAGEVEYQVAEVVLEGESEIGEA